MLSGLGRDPITHTIDASGLGRDPITHTIDASDDWWEIEIQVTMILIVCFTAIL
jgi:hypothetical protein